MENTVSPNTLFGAPNDFPVNDCPVFRWRTAEALRGATCVAYVRAFRTATRAMESVQDMSVVFRSVSLGSGI